MKDDIGTLSDTVKVESAALEPIDGTHLPKLVVEAQIRHADKSEFELTAEMAHLVVALALRNPQTTPKGLLKRMLEGYKISDESWHEKVAPELRKILAARGHVFLAEDDVAEAV